MPNHILSHTPITQTPQQVRGLAVYIHWPFCKSKCPYCDFNSHVREHIDQSRWQAALLKELDTLAGKVPQRTVSSIFFGGGTPSLMPAATAAALIERVHKHWPAADNIEITLEANPTSVEADTFGDFRRAGVNRVSLGVQALDDKELRFLGRGHSAKEALTAVERAAATFERYSFDLIYARPGQTLEGWQKELTQALGYARGHMSLYQLTIEENTAFHHAYAKGNFVIPDEGQSEALYRLTEEMMRQAGFAAYEVSNYAHAGDESRHNLAYWNGDDYIGIGPGAHGRLTMEKESQSAGSQREHYRIATATVKSPERWLEAVERDGHGAEVWQGIELKEEIAERLMMGLRLKEGIDYRRFEARTGRRLPDYLDSESLALYRRQGLLEDRDDVLQATLAGRLVLNRLISELLPD